MIRRRSKHSSIILRSHLFVFFGFIDSQMTFSNSLECLDLDDPEGAFREIKIEDYNNYCVQPMIFPKEPCDSILGKSSSVYFFGG